MVKILPKMNQRPSKLVKWYPYCVYWNPQFFRRHWLFYNRNIRPDPILRNLSILSWAMAPASVLPIGVKSMTNICTPSLQKEIEKFEEIRIIFNKLTKMHLDRFQRPNLRIFGNSQVNFAFTSDERTLTFLFCLWIQIRNFSKFFALLAPLPRKPFEVTEHWKIRMIRLKLREIRNLLVFCNFSSFRVWRDRGIPNWLSLQLKICTTRWMFKLREHRPIENKIIITKRRKMPNFGKIRYLNIF